MIEYHELGEVIETLTYDFEVEIVKIVKFHPWKCFADHFHGINYSKIEYYCENLDQYGDTLLGVLIAWITFHQLGGPHNELVEGLVRLLKLDEFDSES